MESYLSQTTEWLTHDYKTPRQFTLFLGTALRKCFQTNTQYGKSQCCMCAMVRMFVRDPPTFMLKTSFPGWWLGGRAFGKWLGCECRSLINGINVLMKEAPKRSLGTAKRQMSRERALTSESANTVYLDFQHPKLWWIVFIVYKLPSLWYFVRAIWMD